MVSRCLRIQPGALVCTIQNGLVLILFCVTHDTGLNTQRRTFSSINARRCQRDIRLSCLRPACLADPVRPYFNLDLCRICILFPPAPSDSWPFFSAAGRCIGHLWQITRMHQLPPLLTRRTLLNPHQIQQAGTLQAET